MKCPKCGFVIRIKRIAAEIGKRGGSKSRGTISPEQQEKMQIGRLRKRLEKLRKGVK